MSGTVGALIAGAAGAVSLLFGAGNQPVSLGDFVFYGWEVPERISWGGAQRMAIHKMPGGDRVIDTIGRDDADLPWSARLLSPDASSRADRLDQMRVAGLPLNLVFLGRSYTVVIAQLTFDQRKVGLIPYRITCTVLTDDTAAVQAANPSLLQQVTDDLSAALGFNVPAALTAAQVALQQVTPILTPLVSLVGGTQVATSVISGLAGANTLLTSATALANGQIAGLATTGIAAGNLVGETLPGPAASAMISAAGALQTAAAGTAMGGFISRSLSNLGVASGPSNGPVDILNRLGPAAPSGAFSGGGYSFGPEFQAP